MQTCNIVENFQCVIACTHKRCWCSTLIQSRGCRCYICTCTCIQQAANSELAEQQHLTTLPLCDCLHTHKMLFYTIDPKQRVSPLYMYPLYNKQQTTNLQSNNIQQHFHCVIVCTQKVLLHNIGTLTHTEGVIHIYVYPVYNKQQTATGNFLAKKGAIRPSARCHFATNYQLLCQYLFLRYNF